MGKQHLVPWCMVVVFDDTAPCFPYRHHVLCPMAKENSHDRTGPLTWFNQTGHRKHRTPLRRYHAE